MYKYSFSLLFLLISITVNSQYFSTQGTAQLSSNNPVTYRITPNSNTTSGMITNYFPLDLTSSFELNFDMNFGSSDGNGADGMTLFFSNLCNPTLTNGGGLGVPAQNNILVVEFDTYDNGTAFGDISQDHIGIYKSGFTTLSNLIIQGQTAPVCMLNTCGNVENNTFIPIKINWIYTSATQQKLEVYVNNTLRATSTTANHIANIFLGNNTVFWSISGSTGGLSNLQQVRFPTISSSIEACIGEAISLEAPVLGSNYTWSNNTSTTNVANYVMITNEFITCSYTDYCGQSKSINYNLLPYVIPTPTVNITQPDCSTNNGSIEITSPLSDTSVPIPTDLFISEVTDHVPGSLTYIEIYNGTGTPKNLANYKIKVYNNGNTFTSCDFPLSGTLLNNDVFVVAIGSNVNEGGVIPDLVVATCPGVNTNDNIRLTTNANVEIDLWGRTDGVDFTPNNDDGYAFRRLVAAPHPSLIWNAADWNALDPQDYSNVGTYLYQTTSYEYSIDGTTFQANTLFSNLAAGNYSVTAHDLVSGCFSSALGVTLTSGSTLVISNQQDSTCSDVALNYDLGALVTGTGDLYTYTVVSSDATNVPAGAPRTVASDVNITDTYTNTTNAVVTITYTITPTGANGCVGNPFDLVVTVEPKANVTATPSSQTLCTGSSTSIVLSTPTTGTAPVTYQWTASVLTMPNGGTITGFSNDITGTLSSIIQMLQNTGTSVGVVRYVVTPFVGTCAGTSINVDISVNPSGQVNAIPSQALCAGANTTAINFSTLNTGGTTTYAWTNNTPSIGLAASGASTGIPSFTAINSGITPVVATILVTPTFTNGTVSCVGATETFTITVNPIPTLVLSSLPTTTNQTICVGSAITPILYTFDGGATGVNITGLPAGVTNTTNGNLVTISGTPSALTPGTYNYTISATGNSCGTPSLSGTITLTSGIQPTFNQVAAVCEGVTPNLPSSSNNTIPITGFWTEISATASSITYEFTPDPNQCAQLTPPTLMTVGINARPIVTASVLPITNTICSGNTVDIQLFSSVPGAVFSWSSFSASGVSGHSSSVIGSTATSINQTLTLNSGITTAGQVTYAIVAEANGCVGAPLLVTITVNPIPDVVVVGTNPATLCSGETTDYAFESTVNGTVFNWQVQSSTGVLGALNGSGNTLQQQLQTTGLSAGTVVYEVTPSLNGCSGTPVLITVTVNPLPQIYGATNYPDLCSGGTTPISFSTPDPATVFNWTVNPVGVNGASAGSVTGSTLNINQTLTTTSSTVGYVDYIITPSLNNCPGTTVTVRITVNPLPLPTLEDGTLCIDQTTGVVFKTYTLNAGLDPAIYDFVWYFNTVAQTGSNTPTFLAEVAGTYAVIATNTATGCESAPVLATVDFVYPATSFDVVVTDAFSDNATITVDVPNGTGDLLYQLDDGPFQESYIFENVSTGNHNITVIDTEGCTLLTQVKTVIGYPTFFTPNGDGHNDTWQIKGLNQANAKLYIFDRYGKLIKQLSATDTSEGWDGTFNDQLLPSTDYWFSLDYMENGIEKQFKAHFSMKR